MKYCVKFFYAGDLRYAIGVEAQNEMIGLAFALNELASSKWIEPNHPFHIEIHGYERSLREQRDE